MTIAETIIMRLEAQRAKQKKSISKFAKDLNISERTYKDYKKNGCKLSHDELYNVSEKLGCSIDYLYGIDEFEDRQITDINKVTGLSEEAIKALEDERFRGSMADFVNTFVEHPSFPDFASSFASTHDVAIAKAKTMKNEKGDDVQVLFITDADEMILTSRMKKKELHVSCAEMSTTFENYLRYYFDRISDAIDKTEIIGAESEVE